MRTSSIMDISQIKAIEAIAQKQKNVVEKGEPSISEDMRDRFIEKYKFLRKTKKAMSEFLGISIPEFTSIMANDPEIMVLARQKARDMEVEAIECIIKKAMKKGDINGFKFYLERYAGMTESNVSRDEIQAMIEDAENNSVSKIETLYAHDLYKDNKNDNSVPA